MYLPKKEIDNSYFNKKFNLDENWIYKRTGIQKRYWTDDEKTKDLAIKAVENMINENNVNLQNIGLIVVASTNYEDSMPGISFEIQKKFNISTATC